MVHTGVAIQLSRGTYGRVAPRSGLAVTHGIQVGAGVVDSDYRGEVKVLLFNHGKNMVQFAVGDRIAQLVVERIATPELIVGNHYPTSRGAQGFGSAGTSSRNPKVSAMKVEGESDEGGDGRAGHSGGAGRSEVKEEPESLTPGGGVKSEDPGPSGSSGLNTLDGGANWVVE